jgi:hypothetical protein
MVIDSDPPNVEASAEVDEDGKDDPDDPAAGAGLARDRAATTDPDQHQQQR